MLCMANKVVVIGLDGGSFRTLEPWIRDGSLPHLRELIEQGTRGPLTTVVPPETATAWSSFMTGKNPGKHGIFGFTAKERKTGRIVPVSAATRTGRAFWDLLSDAGKKVLVLNVPTTYPPRPLNGVLISGFLTPKGKRDFVYPPSLLEEIEKRFGPYPLYMRTYFSANLSDANAERFLHELHEELRTKFEVLHYLMDRIGPDFVMFHLWGTDRVQHDLWNVIDEEHPSYDEALARKYRHRIVEYFSAVDAQIGRLCERIGEDTTLFIMSDHGFGPIHKTIDLNVWLLEQGYIHIKKSLLSRLRFRAWKMGFTYEVLFKFLLRLLRFGLRLPDLSPADTVNMVRDNSLNPLLSLNDVDWHRTRAYSRMGMGQIVINVEGRDERGWVEEGEAYRLIRDEIVCRLREMRDPATGRPIEGDVFTRDEIYHGAHLEEAPDITFLPLEDNVMASALMGFTTRQWIVDNPFLFGNHRMDGMLIAHGRNIRRGYAATECRLIDLAPTVLHLMGEKIPRDMDGKVLTTIFTEAFAGRAPVEWRDPEETPGGEASSTLSPEEEATILERLKGLGYL
jgi:predicted AlkP superfamily phosphohydrolase/phosphomutase